MTLTRELILNYLLLKNSDKRMAETAILLAIKKISIAVAGEMLSLSRPIIAKKSELVVALPTNMELVKDELEIINAFLKKVKTRIAVIMSWKLG